jgi:DnaK suppressor protein
MVTPHTPPHTVYRDRLLQERQQLLARIAAQRGGLVSRADMAAEHDVRAFDDRAQATTELNEEFAMNEHETAELGAIDAALERIAQGLYGHCSDCGADIGEPRLQAWPTALRCIACQTRAEKTH